MLVRGPKEEDVEIFVDSEKDDDNDDAEEETGVDESPSFRGEVDMVMSLGRDLVSKDSDGGMASWTSSTLSVGCSGDA